MPIFGNILLRDAKKGTYLARNLYFLGKQIGGFNKEYITGSGIILTNNKLKDITEIFRK